MPDVFPGGFDDFADHVVPALTVPQARRVVQPGPSSDLPGPRHPRGRRRGDLRVFAPAEAHPDDSADRLADVVAAAAADGLELAVTGGVEQVLSVLAEVVAALAAASRPGATLRERLGLPLPVLAEA